MIKLVAAAAALASVLFASAASADQTASVNGALIVFSPATIVGSVSAANGSANALPVTVHGNMRCSRMVDNLVGGQNSVCIVSR